MIERNLTEERIYSENEIKIIDMHRQKLLLEPKLQDTEKMFGKRGDEIKSYMPTWVVAQVEFAVGFAFLNQFPLYVQAIIVIGEVVVSGILIYDMKKYFRAKSAFLKTKEKYSQLQEGIKACKVKLTQEEKVYLVLEEGVNLSE